LNRIAIHEFVICASPDATSEPSERRVWPAESEARIARRRRRRLRRVGSPTARGQQRGRAGIRPGRSVGGGRDHPPSGDGRAALDPPAARIADHQRGGRASTYRSLCSAFGYRPRVRPTSDAFRTVETRVFAELHRWPVVARRAPNTSAAVVTSTIPSRLDRSSTSRFQFDAIFGRGFGYWRRLRRVFAIRRRYIFDVTAALMIMVYI